MKGSWSDDISRAPQLEDLTKGLMPFRFVSGQPDLQTESGCSELRQSVLTAFSPARKKAAGGVPDPVKKFKRFLFKHTEASWRTLTSQDLELKVCAATMLL